MNTPPADRSFLRMALGHPAFVLGFLLSALFIALALVSFIWTPFDPTRLDIASKLKGPSLEHWFGTDHFGRDMFSMIMVGARVSIAVAFVAVGIGMLLGVPLGLYAAARRGSLIDEIIMRGNDLVFAFPSLPSSPSASSMCRCLHGWRAGRHSRCGPAILCSRPEWPARTRRASRRNTSCPTSPIF